MNLSKGNLTMHGSYKVDNTSRTGKLIAYAERAGHTSAEPTSITVGLHMDDTNTDEWFPLDMISFANGDAKKAATDGSAVTEHTDAAGNVVGVTARGADGMGAQGLPQAEAQPAAAPTPPPTRR